MMFLNRANRREIESSYECEYLMQLSNPNKAIVFEGMVEYIPVTMPNSNVIMFPSDLYFFFESQTLKDSTPQFASNVGLIITDQDTLEWQNIYNKHFKVFMNKHQEFFQKEKLKA